MSNLEIALAEIKTAQEAGDPRLEGTAFSRAGQIFLERNLYQEAAQSYSQANESFKSAGEALGQVKALNHLGICLVMDGKSQIALQALEEALALLSPTPDPALSAAIQGNMGLAYSKLEEFKNAIKSHKLVLETAEELGDEALQLNALINLGDSNLQNKNYRSALGFSLVALDLAKKLSPHPALTIIYDLLGMISSRQGDLKSAADYHQQAFQVAQEQGDLLRQGIALANRGLALEGLTNLALAQEALNQAESIFELLNSDYLHKTRTDLERVRNAMA